MAELNGIHTKEQNSLLESALLCPRQTAACVGSAAQRGRWGPGSLFLLCQSSEHDLLFVTSCGKWTAAVPDITSVFQVGRKGKKSKEQKPAITISLRRKAKQTNKTLQILY